MNTLTAITHTDRERAARIVRLAKLGAGVEVPSRTFTVELSRMIVRRGLTMINDQMRERLYQALCWMDYTYPRPNWN